MKQKTQKVLEVIMLRKITGKTKARHAFTYISRLSLWKSRKGGGAGSCADAGYSGQEGDDSGQQLTAYLNDQQRRCPVPPKRCVPKVTAILISLTCPSWKHTSICYKCMIHYMLKIN